MESNKGFFRGSSGLVGVGFCFVELGKTNDCPQKSGKALQLFLFKEVRRDKMKSHGLPISSFSLISDEWSAGPMPYAYKGGPLLLINYKWPKVNG